MEERRNTICCAVRTYFMHKDLLMVLLASLTESSLASKRVDVEFFIIDTDPRVTPWNFFIEKTVLHLRQQYQKDIYHHVKFNGSAYDAKKTWGYDATDELLAHLISNAGQCDYFLFTNGDNYYSHYLFTELDRHLVDRTDIVAFDYIHRTEPKSVEFRHSLIDLGAAVISRSSIEKTKVRFLPRGLETPEMVARDWYFFERILSMPNAKTKIIRKTLFVHN